MLKIKYIVILTALLIMSNRVAVAVASDLDTRVFNASVTVRTPEGTGSGTIFVVKDTAYVLTAGHVLSNLRQTHSEKKEDNGVLKDVDVISWGNARIVQTFYDENNDEVGETSSLAKVVAFSPPEEDGGIDLGVLEVVKKDFAKAGAKFLTDEKALKVGTRLYHIGSLYGDITGAYVEGYISRFDYHLKNQPFTVATLLIKPGSSGGAVFTKDKEEHYWYCGMTVRSDGSGTTLLKPLGVIKKFLKDKKLESIITDSK